MAVKAVVDGRPLPVVLEERVALEEQEITGQLVAVVPVIAYQKELPNSELQARLDLLQM
jgi:hypothetical protein